MWTLESDCSGMNYGYHQLGREIGAVSLLYNDILEGTVLEVVLLRCRIFSTEEWRARLDCSWSGMRLLLHEVKVRVRRGVERTPE